MTSIAFDRRIYRREVETLLDQIRREVRELQRLRAAGVRGPGLSERKQRLTRTRERLAAVVGQRAA